MATATFTKTGTKATTAAKLDKQIFEVEVKNHELLKSAYVAYMANGRINLATTKTRGMVRGGGKKPWRQKGTGNARVGSSRNPIWRGGGIVFGPSGNENYSKSINVKSKRLAIRQALTLANQDGKITVIEDVVAKTGKTSEFAKLLDKVGAKRKILVVVDKKLPELMQASNNLNEVKLISAHYVNVFDVLNADSIIISQPALKEISEWLNKEAK